MISLKNELLDQFMGKKPLDQLSTFFCFENFAIIFFRELDASAIDICLSFVYFLVILLDLIISNNYST